ncbi:MBL fold metallo-hydrolase [Kozakia baliensis]|uniref:Uncharacterized protein n=1 Tax=Kozakia baliensis TaxID=153496 RepID=A0A1D8UVY7_9PROT|nr:MBL fold metallo-hydrolase [Kozakia baliensis]AOX17791.1 hypothetical protein A0U89_12310 [Kozakia baliensis]GEL64868.1 hydrolase [Kozakia baliensis]
MRAQTVQVTPLRQNCTILDDPATNRAIVIDPGGDVPELVRALDGLTVEAILLTHGHLDHAGGADELRRLLSEQQGERVPLIGPDIRDKFLMENIEDQAAAFGLSGFFNAHPDRYTKDGEKLRFLGEEFEVALVPGHTPGHVVFINRANRLAIVGDTLFRGVVGRTDFAYGDHNALIAAIREKLLTLPNNVTVLPGHGMPTTIIEERRNNPFLIS